MDIIDLLFELESEFLDRKGNYSKKINSAKCLNIITEIRNSLPSVVKEANYIVGNKHKILENADYLAKTTINEAEQRAAHIIDNSELVKRAEIEANEIMSAAKTQCDVLVKQTKEHLEDTFKDIEQFLSSALTMIRNNREELRGAMIMAQEKRKEF